MGSGVKNPVLLAQVTREVRGMLLLKGGLFLFFLFSGGVWDWEGNLREGLYVLDKYHLLGMWDNLMGVMRYM